jgi:hypothetical protein
MKYKVHFTDINKGRRHTIVVQGNDYGEIADKARAILADKGLTADSADAWTELVKE